MCWVDGLFWFGVKCGERGFFCWGFDFLVSWKEFLLCSVWRLGFFFGRVCEAVCLGFWFCLVACLVGVFLFFGWWGGVFFFFFFFCPPGVRFLAFRAQALHYDEAFFVFSPWQVRASLE